ncbi:hypothetical protein U9M48_041517 [Paspalum notatum var. saurae]|uniref:Uncharacterized protein n=1 Tax=Paspalum notatum var. saurae TaxID=547442 RepID=A0AAQ3UUQ0_PASNO
MAAVANAPAGACCSVARRPAAAAPCTLLPSTMRPPPRRGAGGRLVAVAAFGDVAAEGNTYLIAGAVAVALVGTAFPILFSRKDTCPECDGAGFIRKTGATLRANAARKDQAQIVCPNCNGLGKLGQIDK